MRTGVVQTTARNRIRLVILAVVLNFGFAASAVQASEMTERFIQEALGESYVILNNDTLSDVERRESVQDFLRTVSEFRRTALFILGPYVNLSEQSEIDVFVESFTAYLTSTIQVNLEALRNRALLVTGSSDRAADDSIVMVDIIDMEGGGVREAQAAFRVRENANGDPVIIDIQFEGIWLAITDRADYVSFLRRNGGDLSALSRFVDQQTQNLETSDGDSN